MTQEKLKIATELAEKRRVVIAILTFGIEKISTFGTPPFNVPESFDDDIHLFLQELLSRYEKEIQEL